MEDSFFPLFLTASCRFPLEMAIFPLKMANQCKLIAEWCEILQVQVMVFAMR
jgi:hypothetical protein